MVASALTTRRAPGAAGRVGSAESSMRTARTADGALVTAPRASKYVRVKARTPLTMGCAPPPASRRNTPPGPGPTRSSLHCPR